MKTKHIHKKTLIALSSVLFVAAGVMGIKVQSDHKKVTKAKADSEKLAQEENEIDETPEKQPVEEPVVAAPAPPVVVTTPPAPAVTTAPAVKPKPVYTPAPAPKPVPVPAPAPPPAPKTTKTS